MIGAKWHAHPMRWPGALLLVIAACGRPEIDPAPYDTACTKTPDSCPAPYACTRAETLIPSGDRCYVPCEHDDDCGDGFGCNGDGHMVADLGPPRGYCFPLPD